jgi:hypothetical protein
MTPEDEEFARIEMEQRLREKALQQLHDENERLGLYDEAYGIPFVEKDKLQKLLRSNNANPKTFT